jgi:predicted acetyltransferase
VEAVDDQSLAACAEVEAATWQCRPGQVRRSGRLLRYTADDLPERRDGATPLRVLLAEDAGTGAVRGYAWYRTKSSWQLTGPDATTQVRALDALDTEARVGLLATVLDLDLSARAVFWNLPVDDPLLSLLLEPQRALPTLIDQLWVRLVDVRRALSSRSYGAEADVVLEVADGFCPWNAGRWRLAAGGSGASCERTGSAPDVVLDVRELAAAYLGGMSLAAAGRAGLVEERSRGALATLSRAFVHDPAPWIPFVF